MKCDEANDYIMKYMDGRITDEEADCLNQHLLVCKECKSDFLIYDKIICDFSNCKEFEAPEMLEVEVMAKISQLGNGSYEVHYRFKDKVLGAIWGTFTVLFGTGTVLAMYREPIMESISDNPYFSAYIQKLTPIMDNVSKQTESLKIIVNKATDSFDFFFSNSAELIFGLITIICAYQFYILYRKKKYNKADDR